MAWGRKFVFSQGLAGGSLGNSPQRHQKSLKSIPGAFCMLNCKHRNSRAKKGKAARPSNPNWRRKQTRGDPCRPWKGHSRGASSGFSICSALCHAGQWFHHVPQQPSLTFSLSLKFACMIFMWRKIWHSYVQPLPKCVPCSSLCFSQHNHHYVVLHNLKKGKKKPKTTQTLNTLGFFSNEWTS